VRRAALLGTVALVAAVPATAAAPAPKLGVFVVGPSGKKLAGPVTVSARAAKVAVGGHTCTAPRGTALAALAGVRRAKGPAFRIRDDGSCTAIYVSKISKYAATGASGWVYKVGHRAGTAGAADPSGPFGTGRRIKSGSRVLWFWCRLRGGVCQRTLAVAPAVRTVAPGAPLRVRVRSYDDFARGKAVKGAKVKLGTSTATTNASGIATVAAPAAGSYRLTASRTGLVPPYPERVQVR
jgi:hypothetical protein